MPQRPTTSAFRRPRPTTLALTVVMLGAFIGQPGFAQSESEIRHQEARQSQQIQDLEAEVIALQTRLTTLEQMVRTLQARIQAMSAIGETVEPTIEPVVEPTDESTAPNNAPVALERPKDVFESPATVLAGLKWDFRNELTKDPSFALGVDSANERARQEASSILNSWLQRMNRIYRKSVTWSVRVLDQGTYDKDSKKFLMQAFAPNGEKAGDPFPLITTNRIARRIESWQAQPGLERMLMKGTFEPRLTAIDQEEIKKEESTEEISSPIIQVSPYVRFEYSIRLSTIMPVFAKSDTETGFSGP